MQHLGVGDRGAHVVRDQAGVEEVVLAGRVAEHPLVERLPLVPEACHRALRRGQEGRVGGGVAQLRVGADQAGVEAGAVEHLLLQDELVRRVRALAAARPALDRAVAEEGHVGHASTSRRGGRPAGSGGRPRRPRRVAGVSAGSSRSESTRTSPCTRSRMRRTISPRGSAGVLRTSRMAVASAGTTLRAVPALTCVGSSVIGPRCG